MFPNGIARRGNGLGEQVDQRYYFPSATEKK